MRVLGYSALKGKGIPFSRQWIVKLVGLGKFPAPIKLGEQSVAFVEAEIDKWLAARVRERDEKPVSNVPITSDNAPSSRVCNRRAEKVEPPGTAFDPSKPEIKGRRRR
jgi:prophage regulatory protein